jgi:diamine N-acetyltransferase
MQIYLQKCTLNDVKQIQEIGRATYEPYYQRIWNPGGLDWYINHCFNTERLIEELNDENIAYYLPKDENGNTLGLLKLAFLKPSPDNIYKNALYLEKIYLMPNFFGKDIGQLLIEKVINIAKTHQRQAVWLTVMQSGPIKSYEKAGFTILESIDYGFEELIESERLGWVMVKVLE